MEIGIRDQEILPPRRLILKGQVQYRRPTTVSKAAPWDFKIFLGRPVRRVQAIRKRPYRSVLPIREDTTKRAKTGRIQALVLEIGN